MQVNADYFNKESEVEHHLTGEGSWFRLKSWKYDYRVINKACLAAHRWGDIFAKLKNSSSRKG